MQDSEATPKDRVTPCHRTLVSPRMSSATVFSWSQTGTGGSSLSGLAPPECQGPHLFAGTLQVLCQANRGLFTDGCLPVAQHHLNQKYGPCMTHI